MLTHTPEQARQAPPPTGPFTWECDLCEAKQVTRTMELPEGWQILDEGEETFTFCADCSATGEEVQ